MKLGSTILAFFGTVGVIAGWVLLSVAQYGFPPLPTGWVVAMLLNVVGVAGLVTAVSMLLHRKVTDKMYAYLHLVLACMVLGVGIRTLLLHPLEIAKCPCSPGFWGGRCEPCTCVNGVCNDGVEGTGDCLCDLGWAGEDCDVCAATYQGEKCDECKRGFWKPLEGCKECYPGYAGTMCNQCAANWKVESDDLGLLCRRCEPSYYGPYCHYANTTKCKEQGDSLAFAKDNDWWRANVYTGNTCTPSGDSCGNPYDCESSNCKGQCVRGDETSGDICEDDLECGEGFSCEYKVCCLENKLADGSCECGRSGYVFEGSTCAKCPGFDGVYSASICSGHGTCAAAFGGEDVVGLRCVCNSQGTAPFPSWSGESCGCLIDDIGGACTACSDGYFGPNCTSCPGGAGISQCSKHGVCNDGLQGDGACDCDVDVAYKGLGAFQGEQCDACLSDDFWGDACRPCPNFQVVSCANEGVNPLSGESCSMSCGAQQCDAGGFCQ
jgi:hypothetical protein